MVLNKSASGDYLHIHCGDCSAGKMLTSQIPGTVLVWREIYLEGPVPGDLSDAEFHKVRANFLAGFGLPYYDVLKELETMYQELAGAAQYREVVIWCDACMYDQTIVIHVLHQLKRLNMQKLNVSIVQVSGIGMGDVAPSKMLELFNSRRQVTPQEFFTASIAWNAFSSPDPDLIVDFLRRDFFGLPFLKPALLRHLRQFPALRNGLSLLQQHILAIIAAGESRLMPLFRAVCAREQECFIGDSSFWNCLDELAEAKTPAVVIIGPGRLRRPVSEPIVNLDRWSVTVSSFGEELLIGGKDWIVANGIDRWLGGAHLYKNQVWRWNEDTQSLI
jgi:hypothetical protein